MKDNNRRYVLGKTLIEAHGITHDNYGFPIDPGAPYQMEFGIAWRSGTRTPNAVIEQRKKEKR